jgi:phosphatidylglycerophosphate synthase
MDNDVIKPGMGHMDSVYTEIVLKTVPFWHSIKFTPNMLTTLGLLCSILAIYFLWKRNMGLSILFVLLRQYFDYIDGLTARKYGQSTKIGDWYDHIVDIFGFIIPLLILIFVDTKKRWLYLAILIPAMFAVVINIGCIEKNYRAKTNKGGDSLKMAEKMCFSEDLFKIFDNSFLYLVIILVIILICVTEKNPRMK